MECGPNGLLGLPVVLTVSVIDKEHATTQAPLMVASTVLAMTLTQLTVQMECAKVSSFSQFSLE